MLVRRRCSSVDTDDWRRGRGEGGGIEQARMYIWAFQELGLRVS